jgi:hypothetical protein
MSSLLNNASLLFNPAGSIISYQEDKIYSVIPNNGAGDFTFSGGDGGTRVNQQGYIEQTPANLMTYSEDVSNWTGNLFNNWIQNAVTSNIVIAPNGTLTGDRLGDGYGRFNVSATAIPGQTYTYSVYLKNVSLSANFYIYVAWGLNGTLVSYTAVGSQINVGALSTTEWTRFTFTATAPSSGINQMQFGPCPFTGYGTNPSGQQLDVWGGMINISSTALPYQPTTDRLNYPRITYQNGIGQLMGEPQRTNVLTNSQDLAACLPSQANTTVTADATISPDGTQNADNILFAASSYRLQTTSIVSGTTYCPSIFVKNNTFAPGEFFTLNLSDGVVGGMNVTIYPTTKTITVNSGVWSNVAGRVVPYNNDWFRVELSGTANNTGTGWYEIYTSTAKSVYLWGMQLESLIVSFNPQPRNHNTSYIPTTTSTVTRVRDQYSRSLNSQPTGSIIVKMPNNIVYGGDGTHVYGFFLLGGSSGLGLSLNRSNGTRNRLWTFAASVIYTTTADNLKLGITWDGTYINVWQNGVKVITNYLYALTNISGLESSTNIDTVQSLSQIALYSDILSNTQLQELTTVRSGSGGTISYYGPYTIHTFTGSATFTPSFNGEVEVLVVAGGGSAGSALYHSGGGGAGGLLYVSSYGVAAGSGVTVTIGAGGAAPTTNITRGNNGSNSAFGGLTAIGGGGGGVYTIATGLNGGSGGGGGAQSGVFGAGGLGIVGQGSNGGDYNGGGTANKNGGGGGGAGQIGQTGTDVGTGGNGGNGLPYSISGFSTYYAGGGGGSTEAANLTTAGGLGGGGNGNYDTGQNGVSGLGGGGGAGERYGIATTGAGGSGIVIVRYLT